MDSLLSLHTDVKGLEKQLSRIASVLEFIAYGKAPEGTPDEPVPDNEAVLYTDRDIDSEDVREELEKEFSNIAKAIEQARDDQGA